MDILLIRHGQSLSNAGKPTSSAQNVPLTKLGKKQAECIAEYLKSQFRLDLIDGRANAIKENNAEYLKFQCCLDLIVTSSYARSKQTAEKTMLSFPHVPQKEWSPVREFTFLSLSPNKSSTVDERRPLVEEYWETRDPSYIDGPEVESFEQFIDRVREVMMYFKYTKEYETIAMFSHQQFICALLWLSQRDPVNLSRATMQEFRSFLNMNPLLNGAIVHVQFNNGDEPWQYEVTTSHLEKLAEQEEENELEEPKALELV